MAAIAIDGPSGAGKSTIAKIAAEELGFLYVDTGAMYRAIGLFAVENDIDTKDGAALIPRLGEIRLRLGYVDGVQHIYLNDRDVSDAIRRPEMGMAASNVSAIPEVREFLLGLQRDLAARNNVIMDGRDIGTVILPDAELKLFLTASVESRAERRWLEFREKGEDVRYEEVLADMKQRDFNDENRAAAPLRRAPDAVLVDTSGFPLEKSVQTILTVIRESGRIGL